MNQILEKVKQQLVQECSESDKLRADLISQGKQMNEMHLDHERKINQLRTELISEHVSEVKAL